MNPRFIELQGIALAICCVVLATLRWALGSLANRQSVSVAASPAGFLVSTAAKVVSPPWPTVDRVLENALVAVVVLVAAYGAAPGAAQELSPTPTISPRLVPAIDQFEIAGISHLHASDFYAWMFVAAVAVLLLFNYWLRRNDWRIIGLAVLAMAMCPLFSPRNLNRTSPLPRRSRWISAGFFAVGSVALWFRNHRAGPLFRCLSSKCFGRRPCFDLASNVFGRSQFAICGSRS